MKMEQLRNHSTLIDSAMFNVYLFIGKEESKIANLWSNLTDVGTKDNTNKNRKGNYNGKEKSCILLFYQLITRDKKIGHRESFLIKKPTI